MDFTFSRREDLLRKTARSYLAQQRPDAPGDIRPSWNDITGYGWLDPELDPVALAILAEETGYALIAQPWLITVGLAAPAYLEGGGYPPRPATLALIDSPGRPGVDEGCVARLRDGVVTLRGSKRRVPYPGPDGDTVVLARDENGAPSLFLVTGQDCLPATRLPATLDTTRPMAELTFADTPAEALVCAARTPQVLSSAYQRVHMLLACEAVGIGRRALDLATEHARSRTQFGRPIGSFQAVSHRLAEVYTDVELAAALAYRAAASLASADNGSPSAEPILSASVSARVAAIHATEAAIQTFGAAGYTWDHPAAGLYRRARWIQSFDATIPQLRAELAAQLFDQHDNMGGVQVT